VGGSEEGGAWTGGVGACWLNVGRNRAPKSRLKLKPAEVGVNGVALEEKSSAVGPPNPSVSKRIMSASDLERWRLGKSRGSASESRDEAEVGCCEARLAKSTKIDENEVEVTPGSGCDDEVAKSIDSGSAVTTDWAKRGWLVEGAEEEEDAFGSGGKLGNEFVWCPQIHR
jgi:hypothetical protein